MQIVAVNPFRCRIWSQHPRLDESITEDSCRAQIESFETSGQLVPVLGRRLHGAADHDIELIYGARRLFVARHLNLPLFVDLREISDRDAIIAMEIENRLRQDISAYERAISYARWLKEVHFKSQDELASALQISTSQVSRLLRLAQLPEEVVKAFGGGAEICEGWGVDLANLLKEPGQERQIIEAARIIAAMTPRPPAGEVYDHLCAVVSMRRPARGENERVVKDSDGTALFRIKYSRESVVLVLPLEGISPASLKTIESSVSKILNTHINA